MVSLVHSTKIGGDSLTVERKLIGLHYCRGLVKQPAFFCTLEKTSMCPPKNSWKKVFSNVKELSVETGNNTRRWGASDDVCILPCNAGVCKMIVPFYSC